MGDSLNPTLLNRISRAVRPDFARTILARRIAAGLLVVLAALSALRADPDGSETDVVVAAGDLGPGRALKADLLRLEKRSATGLPDGAL
ncbi:MAG: flagellar biosynthesis protein FlgA, partial [Mycobacteriaceae bacterium]|nr:flagellar biosynthesis protein FlgA [Mycobacteriaceae bacterium]